MSPDSPELPREEGSPLDPAELAAANWLVLHDRGLTAAQEEEFGRWLQADERNPQVYARLDQTWVLLDRVPPSRVPVAVRRSHRWGWAAGSLAAAAAVAFLFVTLNADRRLAAPLMRTAVTPVGGFERIDLPDGSVVRLNTASAVEVAFTATERRVHLTQGEANFAVARDKSRPFVVRVGQVDVRAVGTAFNVRHRSNAIEVLVTEGKVRVDDAVSGKSLLAAGVGPALAAGPVAEAADGLPAPRQAQGGPTTGSPLLTAGQRATISTAAVTIPITATVVPVEPDEAARTLAWQSRRLEFSAEPLANIVAEFNRYNRHQLVVADARLAAQRFGGKFPADDFESLVRLLETNFGVVAERRDNETVLR